MSDNGTPVLHVIAEGKTDFYVIEEILKGLCDGDIKVVMVQEPVPFVVES